MSGAMGYGEALEALRAGFGRLGLPEGRVLLLHVRLRGLRAGTGLDYADCARLVLDSLQGFAPRAVLVPAFTYSFTRSGVFHREHSRAETGRFSEEVRLRHARYRTPDPIFSVVDTTDWLAAQAGVRHDTAFGPGSLWELLAREDAQMINVDIEHMVATFIHHVEYRAQVPYRYGKAFEGHAELGRGWEPVSYDYYVRGLDDGFDLDWKKIKAVLGGVVREDEALGVPLLRFGAKEFMDVLMRGLAEDPMLCTSPLDEMGRDR